MSDWKRVWDSREKKPELVEVAENSNTVYERRGVQQEVKTDPMTGQETTLWVYEQRETDINTYNQLTSPATQGIMQAISDVELAIAML